ncbi:MAG: hypothetical protein AAB932_02030 [Patescibacteria group bacterium]
MKTIFLIFCLLLVGAGCGAPRSVSTPTADMVVHEWGTFTTLHAADGTHLAGLYFDEEQLPRFTYQHGDFTKRAEAVYNKKGFNISPLNEPRNVTVKMETPVIYFYSSKSQDVTVQVDFPQGIISQWYPHNKSGNKMHGNWDFINPYQGGMTWKVTVLPPNTPKEFTPPKEEETDVWTSPRATDANRIESHKGEVEKFIFYRGVARFAIPIETRFVSDNELMVINSGPSAVSKVFVYEKKIDGSENIWWSGALQSGGQQKINFSNQSPITADMALFERALVDAGLYEKEAKALLATWEKSYFKHPGLRVFWIVPEQKVNELLPLTISPLPSEIKRVFMGRIDLLTPAFEKELLSMYQKNPTLQSYSYTSDRYYKGYLERAEQLDKNKND